MPGGIHSEFANSILSQLELDEGVPEGGYGGEFEPYFSRIHKRTPEQTARRYQSADQVAQVVLEIIESKKAAVRIRTSAWAEEFCKLKTEIDPTGKNSKGWL
ncbi:hypothetical protein [Microbulbifer variabilis]|uniref:hypothetical protein n=1 Tax=Microbulbifer variabilis TaxID=266805 RepID=UPI0003A9E3CD|nr:hypothetical protein [Microbulbifer variabilis]